MSETKFSVRESVQELKKLDKALKILGYRNRADWYRELKRKTIREAEERTGKIIK